MKVLFITVTMYILFLMRVKVPIKNVIITLLRYETNIKRVIIFIIKDYYMFCKTFYSKYF